METLLANAGRARREVRNGREYLVAPLTLIVPGVLNGSKGPLFYPPEEIRKDYSAWNGMPLVVYHPLVNGQHVSARHPQVWETQEVGRVFNALIDHYGKLKAEGWFDVEHTARVDNRVLASLRSGIPIELSTGLYTDNDPAPRGANWNGRPYSHIARNYRPDHLAILPDQVGACSVNDGCGVLVNRRGGKATLSERVDELIANVTNGSGRETIGGVDGQWVTISGTHVFIDADGNILHGPKPLKEVSEQRSASQIEEMSSEWESEFSELGGGKPVTKIGTGLDTESTPLDPQRKVASHPVWAVNHAIRKAGEKLYKSGFDFNGIHDVEFHPITESMKTKHGPLDFVFFPSDPSKEGSIVRPSGHLGYKTKDHDGNVYVYSTSGGKPKVKVYYTPVGNSWTLADRVDELLRNCGGKGSGRPGPCPKGEKTRAAATATPKTKGKAAPPDKPSKGAPVVAAAQKVVDKVTARLEAAKAKVAVVAKELAAAKANLAAVKGKVRAQTSGSESKRTPTHTVTQVASSLSTLQSNLVKQASSKGRIPNPSEIHDQIERIMGKSSPHQVAKELGMQRKFKNKAQAVAAIREHVIGRAGSYLRAQV
jgi:hypothetical protein